MKKNLCCLLLLLNGFIFCRAQEDSVRHRLFLLGDGGALQNGAHPVIDWLKKNVDWNDEKNMAIYLGDNVYPYGLPSEGEPSYEEAKKIMDYEISLVKGKKAKAYFVPGNHDWWNGKIGGWQRIQNQVDYINSKQLSNIEAWPKNGCPGPITVEVDTQLVVVLADSQWFLYVHDKPGPGSNCQSKTLDEFTIELEEIINTHPNQLVVLAMHHPLYSEGVHGGAYTWKQHIFPFTESFKNFYLPLPVFGSIYPLARGVFGTVQDFSHPVYRAMAKEIEAVLKKHHNTMAVAGHDHSQQLLMKDSLPFVVSGAVAELTRVRKNNKKLLFSDVNYGFGIIEITKSGKVVTKFYNLQSPDLETPTYSHQVMTIKKNKPEVYNDSIGPLPTVITVAANEKLEEGVLRNLFVGKNYRKEWTQKVTVPVLNLSKDEGGLKPVRKGGGKQTKTLRLEDKSGKEWTLRSIEKFPLAAIPPDLRQTLAKDIVEQAVSASYPYATLSYEPFAAAAGVPLIRRKLVYVPNDPKLERFRADFSNLMAVLEEREPEGVKKTYHTDDLVVRLAKDNDDHVDQKAVLRARLVDNFIMDFDRHEDQWRWATRDTGKGKIYYPISRDHDQAFFVNQGIIPWLGRKPWFVPEVQGFRAKAKNIKTFNRAARNFDRFFLTELSADEWSHQIDTFLNAMTDDVIERALHLQPQEVQQYSMNRIIQTLKKKRTSFKQDMMKYYRFISKEVAVVGTNDREQFRVIKNKDKTVQVIVNKISKKGNLSTTIYDRTFDPKVTHEIQLYGLADDDRFIVEGGNTPILIRMIGGPGVDSFINNGTGGIVRVYDATFEKNVLLGNKGLTNKMSKDPEVNRFDRLNFKYNVVHPGLTVAYNIDEGINLGLQAQIFHQGFRKEPYKLRHFFHASRSSRTNSYRFRYEGDFTRFIGHEDLTVRADIKAPVNVTNFFGFGNYTPFTEPNNKRQQYYQARYELTDISVLMRRQLQSWMRVNYGLTFQHFNFDRAPNRGHYINEATLPGVDLNTLYQPKTYAGLHLKLDIDSRDNKVIPIRGLALNVNARPMLGLNKYSYNLTRADIDMRIYSSLFSYPRFVFATRLGYGHVFGKHPLQIPQAYYLSGIDNLRGFRRDRFSGQTVIYNNNELRFRLSDFSTYLFPGSIGLLAFYDVGRTFYRGERGQSWHDGYGGGIWLAPVKRFVLTGSLCYSKEEKALPLVTFGFHF